jgi:glycosyltransferase involved in cell wall biosynthesis
MTRRLPLANPKAQGPAPWVLVSADFHYRGGQAKANAALAEYLLARGTPVHLVGHYVAPSLARRPAVTVHRVPHPLGANLLGSVLLFRAGRDVARRVCRGRPGTRVLVNGGNCDWPDLNWVHYVHHAWQEVPPQAPWWYRVKGQVAAAVFQRYERQALLRARLVLTNSERTRRDVLRLGVDPARVHNIYLGAESGWHRASAEERAAARARLGCAVDRPLVVFLGGLGHDQRKGMDTLWEAWQRLCHEPAWDAELVVAGGGSGSAAWHRRIARSGLADRVRLLGFIDRVYDLLAAADLLLSPVRYEPYGLNVQEALCRGVPALVSACAGVAERYPAELAALLLPDPEDAGDLAGRLWRWRQDVEGWRRRIEPLAESLRAYSWERMARRIVELAEGTAPMNGEIHGPGNGER